MESFGSTIRKLRDEKGLPLRTVAAFLEMDQAILSKIENGHRKPTKEQVIKLAAYFQADEKMLLVSWLSDRVVYEIIDDDLAMDALHAAEEKVKYITQHKQK